MATNLEDETMINSRLDSPPLVLIVLASVLGLAFLYLLYRLDLRLRRRSLPGSSRQEGGSPEGDQASERDLIDWIKEGVKIFHHTITGNTVVDPPKTNTGGDQGIRRHPRGTAKRSITRTLPADPLQVQRRGQG
jgi:hypothetical protein